MTTSTSFAQMANNQSISLSSALRANTPPTKGQTPSRKFLTLSIFFLLSFFTTNLWGAEVTISVSDFTQCSASEITQSVKGFTFYCENGLIDSESFRSYSGKIFRITSNVGSMSEIEFTFTSSSANRSWGQNATTYTVYPNADTWEITGPNQARIKTIVITYETAAAHTVTWTINPAAGGTLSAPSGTSTTVTPNVAYTYGSPAYTVTPAGKANVSQDGDNFTATPSENCTIQINMVAKPKYTVTLKDDNSTLTQSSAGAVITLPSRDGCGGYTFAGWTKTWTKEQEEWTTTAPTIISAGSYTPTANVNLYPVYTKTATTPGTTTTTTDYVLTDLANIKSTDVVVITSKNSSGSYYAMSNSNGTGSAPTATSVSVSSTKLSSAPNDNLKWNISNNSGTLTIYPNGTTSTWLYCTSTNNGVRVGTNTNKTFTIDPSTGYLKHIGTSRYLGVYNNQDWRCYTSTSTNIGSQTLAFFVETTTTTTTSTTTISYISVPECGPTCIDPALAYATATITKTVGDAAFTNPLTNDKNVSVTYTSTNTNVATVAGNGQVTIKAVGETTIKATWDGSTDYCADEASYTLTVNPKTYRVTFNANGHGTAPQEQTITSGEQATEPTPAPTATGYTFGGWYTNQACSDDKKFDFNTPITDNIPLYAKWTINKYKVTLNPNYPAGKTGTFKDKDGNTVNGNLVLTYDYNTASISLTDLYQSIELEGYQFKDWYSATSGGSKWTSTGTITKDITVYAQWSKLYTITLSENGTTATPITQTSTSYTLPTELSAGSCQDDTKALVGWSTVAIPNPGDKPNSNFYELGETATLTEDQTTFYAVFATPGEGGDDIPLISFLGGVKSELLAIDGISGSGLGDDYAEGNAPYRVKLDNTGDYILYTNSSGSKITKLYIKVKMIGGENTSKITVQTSDNNSDYKDICVWSIEGNQNTVNDIFLPVNSSSKYIRLYFTKGSNVGLGNMIFYTSSTSYSEYVTSCVALPDPVLSFATEPANPIEFTDVACGGNSSKQSVTVVGENLRDVVNVSVTGPYKIARTASTALKDFTTSLTLDKTAEGAIHSNYKTVYIISTPPAQSTEATTGTLTFTTTKGSTLTVNLSTPTVTCTQYTLTLVDRDVSTEQATKYYAGETIDEAPADPEGVCTDPIHYVFDGWAEARVAEGSATYTKVTFPYTVTGNTKFYAVYRYVEDGGADSGDYVKVTENLDDYSGDYLIVYEAGSLALNGALVGDGLDASGNSISVTITDNTIVATDDVNASNFTIAKEDDGYSIRSASGYYIGQTTNANDLKTNSTEYYANTITLSNDDNADVVSSGAYLRYNAATGNTNLRFRYYKSDSYTSQKAIALYRKAASYLYTTSPICGPHLAITEGKDIYVTGGNAGGTRDLVIAQQKVSYKATRLEKDKSTGNLPSIKALPSNIVFDNTKTKAVAVTFDEDSVRTLQSDGTYTITGNITIAYQPAAANVTDDIQVTLNANYNPSADVSQASFTIHARSLPSEFVIVAKSGDKWYALNGDMNNGSSANPANEQVTLDNNANPTKATYAPCNTIYTFDGVPNTGDRTRVRFQGTDGAWLWAASGTNVGIQNKSLAQTPTGDNNAYNWKLETEDNITYKFHNDNNSRLLGLNGEKFGMYASGVQDIRILPYVEKCIYNYAPTNLKVSVLKGTYVTLTWDAVAGATKYQYRTDDTNWTDCGTEPTVTINGLTGETKYTYYIRAYHEDDGVSQECIDYAEITFTTADCDDVPTNITYTADLNSITVSWTAAAPTATITYNTKEDGTGGGGTINNATSPCRISGGLNPNTTYYIQILAGGTCASPIIPVKTEDVEVDIVEWQPQGIVVDVNTNEAIRVSLENEVSFGSGLGTEATELFFSKYYEASYNVKLIAIYNGTKNIIDLTDYTIQYGKTSWETNYITLKDFGATKGQIQPGEEIILYSMQDGTQDDDIMDCVHEDFPDGNWVEVTSSNNDGKGTLSFGGDKTIILCKTEYDDEADEYYDNIIDVIGALKEDPNEGILPTNENTEKPSWGDKEGWVCETGLSIADNSQIGISTNRCLLVRNNTVTSGLDAVAQNIEGDFVTLCSEWKGAQVPDNDVDNGVAASCENFAYVGNFDYSDYYTKYVPMGEGATFDENNRNKDGTVTIPITDLYKHACSNIRVKLSNKDGEVLSDREYKVPIMITTTQGTDGQAFLDLQQNLATKEVDREGNVINTYPLSLDEVREICKTCDVVVRNNATLTKVTDGTTNDHPQVRNVYVYEGASIVIPDGNDHNYTINGLSLRRKGDVVASAQVQGTGKFVLPADEPVCLDLRVDANNWHWFTLPYNCNIADVTWVDGTPAKYNTDWFLMYYDGESRAASTNPYDNHWKVYEGTTIEAGKGYIVGITGDLAHPDYTFELRFPMAQDVLIDEQTRKTVPVNAWGVKSDNKPNNRGWNLVGNPYLNYYKTADGYSPLAGLPLIHYTYTDPVTGEWYYENSGSVPYVATPIDGGWYEYRQELASEVNMMPFTAYFVQVGDPNTHENGQDLNASFEASNRGKKSIVRRAPREVEEIEEPIIVRVELTNSKGESDKTSLVIDQRFTNEYEMNGDFFKWFGDYYNYYTKPVLYTIGADQGKRAFNALNEELAKQPIPMGMYAAQAGNYTFSLNQQFDLSRVEEVWLYDATQSTYTNLMQSDYTFSTSKVNGAGRFSLSVKLAPKVATSIDNVTADKVWATTHTKQVIVNGLENGMHLWLYDATGKLLYNEPTSNYQHTYLVPQTGTYFVSVMNGGVKQTIKVVVE